MNNSIVDKCVGCDYVSDSVCKIWVCPTAKWRLGDCSNATHVDKGIKKVVDEKVRLGQQKQKKIKVKGK